jgi:hypothetical protein
MPPENSTPSGISAICWIGETASLIFLLLGVFSLLIWNSNKFTETATTALLGGLFYVIVGVLGLISYRLLKKLKKSGWVLVIITGIIGIATRLIFFSGLSDILGIIFWAAIALYLWKKKDVFTLSG